MATCSSRRAEPPTSLSTHRCSRAPPTLADHPRSAPQRGSHQSGARRRLCHPLLCRAMFMLRYDMRAPERGPAAIGDLYDAAIEMAVWAEQHNGLAVVVSEHHASPDGYL